MLLSNFPSLWRTHTDRQTERDRPTDLHPHPHPPSTYRTIRSSRPVCKLRTHSTAPCVWLVLLLVWVGNCNTSLNIDFYSSVVGKGRSSIHQPHWKCKFAPVFGAPKHTDLRTRGEGGLWSMEHGRTQSRAVDYVDGMEEE